MNFDFNPLPRSGDLARARPKCPACSTSWEIESQSPIPNGQYTTACGNCEAEGTFTTPSLDAMQVDAL